MLLGSVLVSFITTHGGLHAHPNNINCAIQCFKNPLKESIPEILEQKKSCLTEKEQVEGTLSDCINQKLSCLSEKDYLQGNLTSCKQNSTELKIQLDDAVNKSERLATYVEHLRLLEMIDNHTRELETCRVWLKEYCDLKNKSSSLDEFQIYTMNNFADWLGCKDPSPDANHYDKILPQFTKRIKSILEVREKLEQMLISGNFKAMKNAQDGVKNLPSEKCQFLCTYSEEDEENEESDNDDPSSSFGVKALKAGWNIFTRVWWSGDNK